MFALANKTALVTGAGSGIGAAIAETLARAGAFVFVTDRDAQGGNETVARIEAQSGHAQFLLLDVASEPDCQAALSSVNGTRSHLDIGYGCVSLHIYSCACM